MRYSEPYFPGQNSLEKIERTNRERLQGLWNFISNALPFSYHQIHAGVYYAQKTQQLDLNIHDFDLGDIIPWSPILDYLLGRTYSLGIIKMGSLFHVEQNILNEFLLPQKRNAEQAELGAKILKNEKVLKKAEKLFLGRA